MDSEELRENIAKLQEDYYQKNQKNLFFKKSQNQLNSQNQARTVLVIYVVK